MNVPLTLADFTDSFKIIMARLDTIEAKLDSIDAKIGTLPAQAPTSKTKPRGRRSKSKL